MFISKKELAARDERLRWAQEEIESLKRNYPLQHIFRRDQKAYIFAMLL